MEYVGFLKFLKREKKQDFNELDLPPAPPHGFEDMHEMEFPELKEDFPDLKDFPDMKDFPEPEKEANEPEIPELPDLEQAVPAIGVPEYHEEMPSGIQEEEQDQNTGKEPEQGEYKKASGRLFVHETRMPSARPESGAVYVKVDNFKAVLGSINVLRNDLRTSEEALVKLENLKGSKDKSLDKLMSSLDDMQRKLIFIDKTLFKGE